MKTGIEEITEERQEQIEKHGRSIQMDVKLNAKEQLGYAASLIATPDGTGCMNVDAPEGWNEDGFGYMMEKPYKARLIIAGALIAAEIDRIKAIE